jgi:hypothetical protein
MGHASHRAAAAAASMLALGLVSACSDQSLAELGKASSGWIGEPQVATTSTTAVVVTTFKPVTGVNWASEEFGQPADPDPAAVLGAVIARSPAGERFVPASRDEMSILFPGIEFPGVVPTDVTDITSLVVASATRTIQPGPVAAFGLWKGEPYRSSRSVGQVGVLDVELLGEDSETEACDTVDCVEQDLDGRVVERTSSPDGVTWIWESVGFRYRLFLRQDSADLASAMINSAGPLLGTVSGTGPDQ